MNANERALTITCPKCKAPIGVLCGNRNIHAHKERVALTRPPTFLGEPPRWLTRTCYEAFVDKTNRVRGSIEFDTLAWANGIRVPPFRPKTVKVPDPHRADMVLEVLAPFETTYEGIIRTPKFMYSMVRVSEFGGHTYGFWSGRGGDEVLKDLPSEKASESVGEWRIWRAPALRAANEVFAMHSRERGDFIKERIRDALRELQPDPLPKEPTQG